MTLSHEDEHTVLADLVLSRALAVQMIFVGGLGFIVSFALFSGLYQAITGQAATYAVSPTEAGWWNTAFQLLVLVALVTVPLAPHEWLHGLAIRYYGGTPTYGVGVAHFVLPYAYATTDHRFTRNQFVVVLLTPLIGLTLVGVPAMVAFGWSWFAVPLAANAGGAVGDLWMALVVLGYPDHVTVEDHRSGVRILGRPGDAPGDLSVTALVWDAVAGAGVASVGLLALFAPAGIVLSALGVRSVTVGTPGTVTFLFAFRETPDELFYSVGVGVLVLGALLGLGYAFVRTYWRQHREASA